MPDNDSLPPQPAVPSPPPDPSWAKTESVREYRPPSNDEDKEDSKN